MIGVILTGLLGFGGVAWTLSHNARLERIRSKNALKNEIKKSEIQRDEEVRGIAAALAGEAQNLFRALNVCIGFALDDLLTDPVGWESVSSPPSTPVFDAYAGRVGSLVNHPQGHAAPAEVHTASQAPWNGEAVASRHASRKAGKALSRKPSRPRWLPIGFALDDLLTDPVGWESVSSPPSTPVFDAYAGRVGSLVNHLAGKASQTFGHYLVIYRSIFRGLDRLRPEISLDWAVGFVPVARSLVELIVELENLAQAHPVLTNVDLENEVSAILSEQLRQPPGTTWEEVDRIVNQRLAAARAASGTSGPSKIE